MKCMRPQTVPIRPPSADCVLSEEAKIEKVDRLGELARRDALGEPDRNEADVLKAEIKSWYENHPADKGALACGTLYRIQLGPKRNERTLSDKKKAFHLLRKTLGFDGLIGLLDIHFGALDKTIAKSEQASFVHEERSGYRLLSIVALNPAAVPDALKAA